MRYNRGLKRRKAPFGTVEAATLTAAGIQAATTIATSAMEMKAAKENAKQAADIAVSNADKEVAALRKQNENANNLQAKNQEFISAQNEENRDIQKTIQMNLQMMAAKQNEADRLATTRIQVRNGGSSLLRGTRKRAKALSGSQVVTSPYNLDFSVTDGGFVTPIGQSFTGDLYEIRGNDHNHYHKTKGGKHKTGVGIKFENGEVIEGEGNQNTNQGELLLVTPNDAKFISRHTLKGFNPALAVLNGMAPEQAFNIQENIKYNYNIPDDGKKTENGKDIIVPYQGEIKQDNRSKIKRTIDKASDWAMADGNPIGGVIKTIGMPLYGLPNNIRNPYSETALGLTPVAGTIDDIKQAVRNPNLENIGTAAFSTLTDLFGGKLLLAPKKIKRLRELEKIMNNSNDTNKAIDAMLENRNIRRRFNPTSSEEIQTLIKDLGTYAGLKGIEGKLEYDQAEDRFNESKTIKKYGGRTKANSGYQVVNDLFTVNDMIIPDMSQDTTGAIAGSAMRSKLKCGGRRKAANGYYKYLIDTENPDLMANQLTPDLGYNRLGSVSLNSKPIVDDRSFRNPTSMRPDTDLTPDSGYNIITPDTDISPESAMVEPGGKTRTGLTNAQAQLIGAGITGVGNAIGSVLTILGNNAGNRIRNAGINSATDLALAGYDQLHGIDYSSINRDTYKTAHEMPAIRLARYNVEPQLTGVSRSLERQRSAIANNTMSGAAAINRLNRAETNAYDMRSKLYGVKDNQEEAIKQKNIDTINKAVANNATRDMQSNLYRTRDLMDLAKYNNNIDNTKIALKTKAKTDRTLSIANNNALTRQTNMGVAANAFSSTAQGFANTLGEIGKQRAELDYTLLGSDMKTTMDLLDEYANSSDPVKRRYALRMRKQIGLTNRT